MPNNLAFHLNPENFQIDDRNLEDLILYVTKLSRILKYYNSKNKSEGNWLDFFITDETFLLVIILKFDLEYYENQKLNLIKNFDEFSPVEEKEKIFITFFELIFTYFKALEDWYKGARANNLTQESSNVELELEQAIKKKAMLPFRTFASYFKGLESNASYDFSFSFSREDFSPIWGIDEIEAKNIFDDIDPTQSDLSSGLKKLILLYSPIYKVIFELRLKSQVLFKTSLNDLGTHKPHIGLLLSFLKLFEYLKRDLNRITAKHLNYYYNDILGQKPSGIIPKKMFLTFNIDQNIKSLILDENSKVISGQYQDGSNILFQTNEEVELSNVSISQLITNFISRNNQYEFNSRYNLVAGIFQKHHCASISEVEAFNQNQDVFAALGEEQMFKTQEYKSMDYNELGFAIASPLLVLGKSNRKLNFGLTFSPTSIEYLSNLIIDIANSRGLSEEDIFNEIFSKIFIIEYTNEIGWVKVDDYVFEYPEDWSLGKLSLTIKLDKKAPAVENFNTEIHKLDLECRQPLFTFKLNPDNFYFGYSFLSGMELSKIEIQVIVSDLKEIKAFNSLGELDLNSEFEMLGATPKKGAYVLISSHELFCKPINHFDICWEFTNLPTEVENLEEYYANYNREIKDNSFQFELTALSDFSFKRKGAESFKFDMFQNKEDSSLDKKRNINKIEASRLKLKPNYNLRSEDLEEFSNDSETGYVKLELIEPNMGFGFDLYPVVYNEAVSKATSNKLKSKNSSISIPPPNEPFSPTAENVSINYHSETSLHFNQSSLSENDYEQDNAFFLFKSSNIEQTFSKHGVKTNKIIPLYEYEGELLIGLENISPPQYLNLLVEVKKSENANYQFSNKIEWLYTSYDGWRPFAPSDIIYDETINLMKTGVISLRVPQDISNSQKLYGSDDFFIKACSKNKADQLSLIKSIYTNGVSATEIIPEHLEATNQLPPNSAEGLEVVIPEIIDVIQPYSTLLGKATESNIDFYSRMSELLKHKKRPVTKSDIEQFLLSKFDYLSYVKCYFQDENLYENDAANLKLLCLKKLTIDQNIEEVKLSLADIEQIQDYLEQYVSPFVKIEVVNPVFEDIWFKCKIKFSNISAGKGVRKLNHDFFKFMTPWYNAKSGPIELRKSIKKSEIFNFIKQRPYISFVTGISIIHIKQNIDGGKIAFDSAADENNLERIETGSLESIFVPRIGIIDLLETEEYSSPEPINYGELNLEQNFIITSGKIDNEFGRKDDFDSDDYKNNENIKPTTLRFKL